MPAPPAAAAGQQQRHQAKRELQWVSQSISRQVGTRTKWSAWGGTTDYVAWAWAYVTNGLPGKNQLPAPSQPMDPLNNKSIINQ